MSVDTTSSRRNFLMGAGVVAGLAAAAGTAAVAQAESAEEALISTDASVSVEPTYSCDVVVAGAGVGGLAAAVAAVEAGAQTILVEASGHVGGTSRFAAGALGPRFGTDWNAVYAKVPLSDPDLGKVVCVNWADTVEWIDGLGLTTEQLSEGSSYLWMGGRRPAEQGSKSYTDEYLQQFGQIFNDKGGTTLLSTRATDLVYDESGAPAGLVCTDAQGARVVVAAKQVIIATGGFQCNKEMMTRYLGRHADVSQAQCVPYLDGAGIIMAQKAGAKLSKGFGSYYGHPQPWPQTSYCTYDTPEGYEACENIDDVHMAYYGATVHAIQTLGMYVNCSGKRFVNEGLTSSLVNQEIMQQFYARAYLFFDEAAHQTMVETAYCNAAVVGGDRLDWLREHGATVVQADTLEELATKVATETVSGDKFNANGFLRTATEWNDAIANGTTDALEVPVKSAMPLTTPPFYCIPVVAGVMGTFGGIKIDVNAQVVGQDDRPMAGLWAVPGAAGGIMEGDYWCVMSGYTVFGRVAGTNAAMAALSGDVPLASDVIAANNEAAAAISAAAAKAAEEAAAAQAAAGSSEEKARDSVAGGEAKWADGTYTGDGKGMGGSVPVTVTVEGGAITAVEVGDNSETDGIGTKAISELPGAIIAANGTEGVDAVSGATVTSKAILSAVDAALEGAAA